MTGRRIAAAKKLAKLHREAEPQLQRVFLLSSSSERGTQDPIKLLEVVEGAVEAGVMPIFFRADSARGIDFPSVVIELSPKEFKGLGKRRLIAVNDESWEIGEELLPRV